MEMLEDHGAQLPTENHQFLWSGGSLEQSSSFSSEQDKFSGLITGVHPGRSLCYVTWEEEQEEAQSRLERLPFYPQCEQWSP